MTKGSTKYQLLKDDFNHATEQLKLYRKEIECLKKVISNSKHENRRLEKENEEYLDELAKCREHLLPLMESYEDYDDLFCMTVAEPLAVKDLCERVAEEFYVLK
ncbi:hypothetical protein COK81_01860 [Bacillus thuringiensis]|uniref:Uncharacterized protein n=1 Tax=Bacillus thuringiensis TaxID=1428 RepID=A0A9X7G406_BACTU|nr:hypothetical protein [Bacillus thuringiensis]PFU01548.1 hypothetical protein COK81_01860 [Bacillus thuringiensis]PRT05215.1 hypothetical protein C6352_26430 [Bacillus thuringiensis]